MGSLTMGRRSTDRDFEEDVGAQMSQGEIDRRCAILARLRTLGLSQAEILEALDPEDLSGACRDLASHGLAD